jgi:hypothetical protein
MAIKSQKNERGEKSALIPEFKGSADLRSFLLSNNDTTKNEAGTKV